MEKLKIPHHYRDGPWQKHDWHGGLGVRGHTIARQSDRCSCQVKGITWKDDKWKVP